MEGLRPHSPQAPALSAGKAAQVEQEREGGVLVWPPLGLWLGRDEAQNSGHCGGLGVLDPEQQSSVPEPGLRGTHEVKDRELCKQSH